MDWTKEHARRFLVNYHNINTSTLLSIEDVFDRLNSIQYDPLNVVGTNPELVLQSRIKGFKKEMLEQALYQDRTLIDGWDKQMCIYQATYYPHYKRVREDRAKLALNIVKHRLEIDILQYTEEVLNIVSNKGPILSADIKFGETKQHRWGHTKPSSATLDYLFHHGKIGVHSRRNTQKRYDLMDRLIDTYHDSEPFQSENEFLDFHLLRRIESMGLVWNKSGYYFSGVKIHLKPKRTTHLNRLIEQGYITEVHIDGIKEPCFIPTSALDIPIELEDRISFLAPLDNMLWNRDLVKELFDFDYVWEVYVPQKKRIWGYYVLPIIKEANIIGRIEFEQQRNNDPLIVKRLFLEDGIKQTKKLDKEIYQALKQFATYLGAKEIIYKNA